MPTEIERKFLLQSPPIDQWGEGVKMRQGYLARGEHATARVRVAGTRGRLTIKGPTVGISRAEFEYEIPCSEAEELLTLCEGGLIEKRRWRVPYQGHVWEVDVFEGENSGLLIAEIELSAEDETFERPDWIGAEVSGDPRYFNGYLSRHPYQTWREPDQG